MLDVERGAGTRNVAPDEAYGMLAEADRSPLTIAEGIALLTHHPEFLQPNHGFSLLASRCGIVLRSARLLACCRCEVIG